MPKKKADHKQTPHQIETTADLDFGGTQYRPVRLYWLTLVFTSHSSLAYLKGEEVVPKGCGARMSAHGVPVGIPESFKIAKLCSMRPPRRTADPWGRVCTTKGQPSNEPTSRRALAALCGSTQKKNANSCRQAAEPGVAVWVRSATAVRYAGMQVRSELDSAQARKRRGTGRSRGILFGGCQDMSLQPPLVDRRGRGSGRAACSFFFGRASPIGPRKGKPDSAPFPWRQPNPFSGRRHAVNGRAGLSSTCKGPGIFVRCRISGAGKRIAC